MPFLKENALGQNKAIFIQNLLFSNCADSRLYKIYFRCKDPTFLGRIYKQNGAEDDTVLKQSTLPRPRAVQETLVQGHGREPRQWRCGRICSGVLQGHPAGFIYKASAKAICRLWMRWNAEVEDYSRSCVTFQIQPPCWKSRANVSDSNQETCQFQSQVFLYELPGPGTLLANMKRYKRKGSHHPYNLVRANGLNLYTHTYTHATWVVIKLNDIDI